MKTFLFLLIFILICFFLGNQIGIYLDMNFYVGGFLGIGFGLILIFLNYIIKKVTIRTLSAIFFGLFLGLALAFLINYFLNIFFSNFQYIFIIKVLLTLLFIYLGILIAVSAKEEFNLSIPYIKLAREGEITQVIILDTSVIIDGRIVDIINTGFIEGKFIIPRFVLKELQQIADSKDNLKRNRGRRGLDVLNKIKSFSNIQVSIQDQDFPEIKEVDAKLIKLAKIMDAKILTNDYNLNKVAEFQGVAVLNINELSNALKPIVLPGERINIKLVKKGKESNQALGYFEDGTMIVVDDSQRFIGKNVDVEVTSVLQTSAGRMIFATISSNKK